MSEPFELTSPELPELRRDYRAEIRNSRTELASKMVMLREARLEPSPEVIVTAQFLIFMGPSQSFNSATGHPEVHAHGGRVADRSHVHRYE